MEAPKVTHSSKLTVLLFAVLSTLAHAQDIGWYSGKSSPYSISNANELKGLAVLLNDSSITFSGKTILLTDDIVLAGNWTPMNEFQGVFDGQNHTIYGLSVDIAKGNAGFFSSIGNDGVVKNLKIIASKIKTADIDDRLASGNVGGLVGYSKDRVKIENCSVIADSILASRVSGGLVGQSTGTLNIENSHFSGNVSVAISNDLVVYAGGLIGFRSSVASGRTITIENSHAEGNVSSKPSPGVTNYGSSHLGGLIGFINYGSVIVANSYASVNISAVGYEAASSGGLIGRHVTTSTLDNISIVNSYSSGNISSTTIGTNNTSTFYYSSGAYSGGLIGVIQNQDTAIRNSYSTGDILASSPNSIVSGSGGLVGGKVAATQLEITNSYGSGNVSAGTYSGGLVGYTTGSGNGLVVITNSYASGNISGTYSGGIFGVWTRGMNSSVYYNSESASKAAGEGSPTGISGKSVADLKKQATFRDWDFDDTWGIYENESYPYLALFGLPSSSSVTPSSSSIAFSSSSEDASSSSSSVSSSSIASSSSMASSSSSSFPVYTCQLPDGCIETTVEDCFSMGGYITNICQEPNSSSSYSSSSVPTSSSSSSSEDSPSSSSTTPPSSSSATPPSSSSEMPPSSSSVTPPSSSSVTLPSSSSETPSSSSDGDTPIRLPQTVVSNQAAQIRNGINLYAKGKAVIEVYGLTGNLVSRQNFASGAYIVSFEYLPKGMYIARISFGNEKKMLRMAVY